MDSYPSNVGSCKSNNSLSGRLVLPTIFASSEPVCASMPGSDFLGSIGRAYSFPKSPLSATTAAEAETSFFARLGALAPSRAGAVSLESSPSSSLSLSFAPSFIKSDQAELSTTGADPSTPLPEERLLRAEATPEPSLLRISTTAFASIPRFLASLLTSSCVPPPGATTSEFDGLLLLDLLLRVGGIVFVFDKWALCCVLGYDLQCGMNTWTDGGVDCLMPD
mmetsp:Transcript_8797/g.13294  ORF Transcript_8797/g.13294 Transcript_8797/m.13294 type:complete len:222 (-) Transcript_8797:28-693(-)